MTEEAPPRVLAPSPSPRRGEGRREGRHQPASSPVPSPSPLRGEGRGAGHPRTAHSSPLPTLALLLALASPALALDPSTAAAASSPSTDYPQLFGLNSRNVVWFAAQLHLLFGAFVLGVPIFAVLVEAAGLSRKEARYDRLAREFTKLLTAAFSTTAAFGGLLVFVLLALYPKVMTFLGRSERPSFLIYPLLFFCETFTLYLYYYGWDRLRGDVPRAGRAAGLRTWAWRGAALAAAAGLLFYVNPGGRLHEDPWVDYRRMEPRNAFFQALGDRAKAAIEKKELEPTPAGLAAAFEKGMDGLVTPEFFVNAQGRALQARVREAARRPVEVRALDASAREVTAEVGAWLPQLASPAAADYLAAIDGRARAFLSPKIPVTPRGLATLFEQAIAAAPVPSSLLADDAVALRDSFAQAARELRETPEPATAVDAVIERAAGETHEAIERSGAALAARQGRTLGTLAAAAVLLAGVAAAATHAKAFHLYLGFLLNLVGTLLMVVANSWVTFLMTPSGINKQTGLVITYWNAFFNPLWMPLNLHRLLGNVAFGGFVCGAYAAMRYLGSRTQAAREHYDWMGYVGNVVGVAALIPLPFAGYYLGREVYAADINMGMQMMGGTFSWTFIVQALLIGSLFVGANYYLWMGIHYRSRVADRYSGWLVWINALLLLAFAVWLTPRNLPLTGEELGRMGGASHPILKFLGLMSGKLAAVNLMILLSFVSFLLYRRSGLEQPVPLRGRQPSRSSCLTAVALALTVFAAYLLVAARLYLVEGGTLLGRVLSGPPWLWGAAALLFGGIVVGALRAAASPAQAAPPSAPAADAPPRSPRAAILGLAAAAALVAAPLVTFAVRYGATDFPALAALGLKPEDRPYLDLPVFLLAFQAGLVLLCLGLTAFDHGKLAQSLFFLVTTVGAVLLVGTYGYVVMEKANEGLRVLSVTQVLLVLSGLVYLFAIDVVVYHGAAKSRLEWGRMPARSQYVLIFLAVMVVLTMGLMGFVRSGLRENWHVRNVLADTSPWAGTPSVATMGWMVSAIVLVFLALVSFIFWLSNLGEKESAA
ncbi:MAG: cytochrome ubiquinol oxidase subunit I [Planctomycetes bacterium]|nr:cytochrome ubiquinol oxidase subunit I [Planctomycetota bacterium]